MTDKASGASKATFILAVVIILVGVFFMLSPYLRFMQWTWAIYMGIMRRVILGIAFVLAGLAVAFMGWRASRRTG